MLALEANTQPSRVQPLGARPAEPGTGTGAPPFSGTTWMRPDAAWTQATLRPSGEMAMGPVKPTGVSGRGAPSSGWNQSCQCLANNAPKLGRLVPPGPASA